MKSSARHWFQVPPNVFPSRQKRIKMVDGRGSAADTAENLATLIGFSSQLIHPQFWMQMDATV